VLAVLTTATGVMVVVVVMVVRRLMSRGWQFSLRVDLDARARGKDAQQGATRLFIEFLRSSFCASRRAAAIIPRALKFPAKNGAVFSASVLRRAATRAISLLSVPL
jgi:intergrase/recombinase